MEAPDGTLALCNWLSSIVISTSTVGFPRESIISRACTFVIVLNAARDDFSQGVDADAYCDACTTFVMFLICLVNNGVINLLFMVLKYVVSVVDK